jgi:hypothetical protein
VAEEGVRSERHRLANVSDDELRQGDVERALDNERRRASRNRLRGEIVAVRLEPGDAEKEGAGPDAAGVVGEIGDVRGSGVERARGPDGLRQGI